MTLYNMLMAGGWGYWSFNVILEVFINFTNINGLYKLCECVHVCMYVSQYEGLLKRGLSSLKQLL